MLHQQNTIDIAEDQNMKEFFEMLDIMSAFKKLHGPWSEVNRENWYSKELIESIDATFRYVNQLASYISVEHEDIEIGISYDQDNLKGKQFSTAINRTDEWKILKKFMKMKHDFPQQTITVQALVSVILKQIEKFMQKMR